MLLLVGSPSCVYQPLLKTIAFFPPNPTVDQGMWLSKNRDRFRAPPCNEKFHGCHNWLVVEPYPSEKYEFVSWDDYSQYMESHKIHVPNHHNQYMILMIA